MKVWKVVSVVIGLCLFNERWTAVVESNASTILIVSAETSITDISSHILSF